MDQYLLDTVTVVRHFTGQGDIGQTATQILDTIDEQDTFLVVSIISLMSYAVDALRGFVTLEYGGCKPPTSQLRKS